MLPLPLCFEVNVNLAWYLGLPAATWLIYLSDHVLDSLRNPDLESDRHVFVRTYQTQIYILMAVLLFLCGYLSYAYYNVVLFLTAFTLLLFCTVYFLLTSITNPRFRYFYNKELMVATVYATALYLSIGLSQHGFGAWLLYFIALLLITYLNLLTISIIERPDDVAHHQFSWVVVIGKKRAVILLKALISFTILFCIFLMTTYGGSLRILAFTYALMALAHGIIFVYASKLLAHEAYRKWSEVSFWLPIIVYILA
jgi:1,4-dihydroxy-2-naphthoate octaprenyltransferase